MSAITRGVPINVSSTVGTSSTPALVANQGRNFLQIQNTSTTTGIQYTLDGSTPVINGNGIYLAPTIAATYDVFCPTGVVNIIGSAAGSTYTIVWF